MLPSMNGNCGWGRVAVGRSGKAGVAAGACGLRPRCSLRLGFPDCHGFWGPPIDGDKIGKIGHDLLSVIKQGGGPWQKDRQPNRPDLFVAFVCR
jgi:hypothetical protein